MFLTETGQNRFGNNVIDYQDEQKRKSKVHSSSHRKPTDQHSESIFMSTQGLQNLFVEITLIIYSLQIENSKRKIKCPTAHEKKLKKKLQIESVFLSDDGGDGRIDSFVELNNIFADSQSLVDWQ